jgi:lipoyl(octanoyl) transferase
MSPTRPPQPLRWAWLGQVPYGEALARQRARRRAIQGGRAPEAIWLLEHAPVVTTGRRPAPGTPGRAALAAHGVALHETERGGLATYHAPGQLVAYLLVDTERRRLGVRRLVSRMEDAVIGWLDAQGVAAGRRDQLPGVWVGSDKIAALGLHVRRGVTMHGLALNLRPELAGFELIVPCGVVDGGITSLARLRGRSPSPAAAAASLGAALVAAVEKDLPTVLPRESSEQALQTP